MKLIRNISLSAVFCLCYFFIISATLADEWILELQIAKDTWGLEEQSPKYEWGLEEQTPKHDKSDSIILHYDGNSWAKQESNITHRLNRIWGDSKDNLYVVGINSSSHYNHMLDVSYGTK